MDASTAKTEQSTAKRLFTMARNQLMRSMGDGASMGAVQSKFQSLNNRMEQVMDKHATYLAHSHADESDPTEEEQQWLQGIEDGFAEAERSFEAYANAQKTEINKGTTDEVKTILTEVKKKTRLYRFEIDSVQAMMNALSITVDDDTSSVESIKDAQSELKNQMECFRLIQRELITILVDDTEVDRISEDMQTLHSKCAQINIAAGKAVSSRADTSREKKAQSSGIDLKMERMKLPVFKGNIRDYLRFKADFTKHVMPLIKTDDSAAYILKSCLEKEPLDAVKNIDDNLAEMWKRLDERYGRSSKIVDAIMYEIKQLKAVSDGDGSKFIQLVDVIEKCYLDLVRANMESEICNSTIVSLIEEKLPPTIKTMWCLDISDKETEIEDSNKFPKMLEFMLKHKRAIEYGSSDLRTTGKVHFGLHLSQAEHTTPQESKKSSVSDPPSEQHTPKKNERKPWCWLHSSSQHDIFECLVFKDMTPESRMDMACDYRACWSCLQTGHSQSRCFKLKECMKDGCKKRHHPMLHQDQEAGIKKVTHVSECSSSEKRPGFLQIMRLRAGIRHTMGINILWDSGAQVSLITLRKAKELGLSGVVAKITIVKIGNVKETVNSRLYEVPIVESNGNIELIKAYGIPQISSEIESIEINSLANELEVSTEGLERPTGEIDMLIGYEYAGFHPERIKSRGHLLLLQNKFGKCLGGAHQLVEEKTKMIVQNVQISHASVSIEEFFSNESLGVSCTPKCGSCRCGECPLGSKQYSLQEERELALIESGLSHEEGQWTATYPWIRDPKELPDNYTSALSMMKSLERRLTKHTEHSQVYQDQIQDMIDRGVAEKLDQDELSTYTGPVYYLSHHEVLKPDSESTPCRIVFNSSSKFKGHVLNEYWAKGPDLMNNLLGVLVRFRENCVAVAGDIRKMYHSVAISELDQHTHRFVWRNMDSYRRADIYKIKCVSFGDKPAGSIAALALRKTAEMGEEEFPTAAETIKNNAYVDDILGSVPSEEEADKITDEIDDILSKGGFQVKSWTKSSNKAENVQVCPATLSGSTEVTSKVLGIVWNSKTDTFEFVAKVNFSPKHRKVRTQPNLAREDLPQCIPDLLTKRMVLSLVNGIYDPLGLSAPFVVQAKMLLRKISKESNVDWDDPIPEVLRNEWVRFFTMLFDMEKIVFQRSTKPPTAIGEPSLVLFSDASEEAFGACAYVRWSLQDGGYQSNLLVAKSRLSPMRKITIPRLELNGALLAARLNNFITKECSIAFTKRYFVIDSEIVRAQIQRESYGFNTFAGVRIGEIQELTQKNDWYWIESAKNIADIISRGADPSDMGSESEWQRGPVFLEKAVEEWPVKQTYSGGELPDQVIPKTAPKVLITQVVNDHRNLAKVIDIGRYSSYPKLLRVTARVSSVFKHQASLRNVGNIPNQDQMKDAELMWIQDAQRSMEDDVKPQTMRRLGASKVNGIFLVGSRLESWTDHTYNNKNPILLSAKSQFARLYAQHIHDLCHLGTSAVACKIRAKFWIIGLRKLLRSIKFKCVVCKKSNELLQQQVMGQLPEERTKPAPGWSYVSLDLFGPYLIRGEVNKRTRGRGYGLIINCLLTRAVHLDIVSDYSTDSFLLALRRFISLRGSPMKVYSDRGSQLRAADKELKEIISLLDEAAIAEFSTSHSIEWEFSSPGAPWQNGCSESLIKSVKKSLKIAVGKQALSFPEFQTALMECANLINDRPIGRHPTSPEDGVYLSPNDLLLGHSTHNVPQGPFDFTANKYQRFKFVQRIADAFWKRWTEAYFPSLIVQQKWHTSHRNVRKDDVVIVQDSNLIRGKWRLGRITKAESSLRDGFVRNVEIEYKNPCSKNFLTITRPVQRVIVLVPAEEQ